MDRNAPRPRPANPALFRSELAFLFSDLKGSTALYERVGDLVAFDLVDEHFRLLQEIIASERGAIVKTIGDAVMDFDAGCRRALPYPVSAHDLLRPLQPLTVRRDLKATNTNDRQTIVFARSRVRRYAVRRGRPRASPQADG